MLVRKGLFVSPAMARQFDAFPSSDVDSERMWSGRVWRRPAPAAIPMGWSVSVFVAQALQDSTTSLAGLPEAQRFHPDRPVPIWTPIWGSIIDDVWGVGGKGDERVLRQ